MSNALPSDFHIRVADVRDLESLVTFNEALAWETEERRLDRSLLQSGVGAVLADPARGRYVVIEHRPSGQVIGQLLITFEWSDWRNRVFWWLHSVYVHRDWRRRGIWKHLHDYVVRDAEDRGNVAGIRLYVEQHNTIAQKAYDHSGLSPSPYRMFEKDFVLPSRQGE